MRISDWSSDVCSSDLPPMAQRAGFADLVARVKPAVVNIATTAKVDDKSGQQQMPNFPPGAPFEEFFSQFMEKQARHRGPQHALVSGFIVEPSGWNVTNNQVIRNPDKHSDKTDDGTR